MIMENLIYVSSKILLVVSSSMSRRLLFLVNGTYR
jgi:hypothetical protein